MLLIIKFTDENVSYYSVFSYILEIFHNKSTDK